MPPPIHGCSPLCPSTENILEPPLALFLFTCFTVVCFSMLIQLHVLPQVLSSSEKSSSNYISENVSVFSTYLASLSDFILKGLKTNSKYEQNSSPMSYFKPSTFFQPFNQFCLFSIKFKSFQCCPFTFKFVQPRLQQLVFC